MLYYLQFASKQDSRLKLWDRSLINSFNLVNTLIFSNLKQTKTCIYWFIKLSLITTIQIITYFSLAYHGSSYMICQWVSDLLLNMLILNKLFWFKVPNITNRNRINLSNVVLSAKPKTFSCQIIGCRNKYLANIANRQS